MSEQRVGAGRSWAYRRLTPSRGYRREYEVWQNGWLIGIVRRQLDVDAWEHSDDATHRTYPQRDQAAAALIALNPGRQP